MAGHVVRRRHRLHDRRPRMLDRTPSPAARPGADREAATGGSATHRRGALPGTAASERARVGDRRAPPPGLCHEGPGVESRGAEAPPTHAEHRSPGAHAHPDRRPRRRGPSAPARARADDRRALREFRKIQDDVKDTIKFDMDDEPEPFVRPKKTTPPRARRVATARAPATASPRDGNRAPTRGAAGRERLGGTRGAGRAPAIGPTNEEIDPQPRATRCRIRPPV